MWINLKNSRKEWIICTKTTCSHFNVEGGKSTILFTADLLVSSKHVSSVSVCDSSFFKLCQITEGITKNNKQLTKPRSASLLSRSCVSNCIIDSFFQLISAHFADRMQWCLFSPLSLIIYHILWHCKPTAPECLFPGHWVITSIHHSSSILSTFFNAISACNIKEYGSSSNYIEVHRRIPLYYIILKLEGLRFSNRHIKINCKHTINNIS